MKQSKKSTVLCYVRPWNVSQFKFLAQQVASESVVIGCSEHSKVDESGLVQRYSALYKMGKHRENLKIAEIADEDINDVIVRCRLLRKLSDEDARRHVWAMGEAIGEILDVHRPRLILSLTVDSYVIDLIRLLAESKKIQFVAFIGTFVNGYYRISARGEPNFNPAADPSLPKILREILLKEDYSPAFNKKSLIKPRRSVYRRWVANIARVPYFWLTRVLSGDYYNYHSWASQVVSAEQFHFFPPSDPGQQQWLGRIRDRESMTLFIPLQMFPECTVDYWCQNSEVIKYYDVLNSLVDKLSTKFHVVIKEHPSVMGSRPTGFYSRLSKDPRITVVPTYTPSNEVLSSVDGVVVWTGSVGFEAMLRGKPVFGLAKPFYASGARFKLIGANPDLEAMTQHIEFCKANAVSAAEQDSMLEFLGSQLFQGDFINDGSWTENDFEHVKKAQDIARSLTSGFIQDKI